MGRKKQKTYELKLRAKNFLLTSFCNPIGYDMQCPIEEAFTKVVGTKRVCEGIDNVILNVGRFN